MGDGLVLVTVCAGSLAGHLLATLCSVRQAFLWVEATILDVWPDIVDATALACPALLVTGHDLLRRELQVCILFWVCNAEAGCQGAGCSNSVTGAAILGIVYWALEALGILLTSIIVGLDHATFHRFIKLLAGLDSSRHVNHIRDLHSGP